jgi:hypothetical protein
LFLFFDFLGFGWPPAASATEATGAGAEGGVGVAGRVVLVVGVAPPVPVTTGTADADTAAAPPFFLPFFECALTIGAAGSSAALSNAPGRDPEAEAVSWTAEEDGAGAGTGRGRSGN